ncbi:UNVERIFIED_CONTAM: hypothetical protein GTU68_039026 [Idotea baltica]|nr:hypothetical protein [Idotea baltica]
MTPQELRLKYANRHGLITGATGTGKTITLQVLVESFSAVGVPVFTVDMKGDLSGIAKKGVDSDVFNLRAKTISYDRKYAACPTIFWDVFAKRGHPLRVTISEMGPLLLSRLLELNDTQAGVLDVVFAVADAEKLLLLDLADLRAMLVHVSDEAKKLSKIYGLISSTTISAIQRNLLRLERDGADALFGEPVLDIADIMQKDAQGHGVVSILAAEDLINSPKIYSAFMLWLLSELFEQLPEVGDADKPELVFFFDEAHLLFDEAPKVLIDKIEQLVRLIRSKGVGIYFVTQSPGDIPEDILSQLGNRVQHALRAYTPKEQKNIKAAAQSFRANPEFDTEEVIGQLGSGEALVSVLDKDAKPSIVERTLIRPPNSFVGPLTDSERTILINESLVAGKYREGINRESAYELLAQRAGVSNKKVSDTTEKKSAKTTAHKKQVDDGIIEKTVSSMLGKLVTNIGTQVARELTRSLLRTLRK